MSFHWMRRASLALASVAALLTAACGSGTIESQFHPTRARRVRRGHQRPRARRQPLHGQRRRHRHLDAGSGHQLRSGPDDAASGGSSYATGNARVNEQAGRCRQQHHSDRHGADRRVPGARTDRRQRPADRGGRRQRHHRGNGEGDFRRPDLRPDGGRGPAGRARPRGRRCAGWWTPAPRMCWWSAPTTWAGRPGPRPSPSRPCSLRPAPNSMRNCWSTWWTWARTSCTWMPRCRTTWRSPHRPTTACPIRSIRFARRWTPGRASASVPAR